MEQIEIKNKYEKLLRKYRGLLKISSKIPVRDRRALSLAYTPGVGESCLLIQKDNNESYSLTNKGNSILIVSNNINNYCYLEAFAVYYKVFCNIDAYPIIVDSNLIHSKDEFAETIKAVMPAFSSVEFFGIDDDLLESLNSENLFSFISYNKFKLQEKLNEISNNIISTNQLISGIIRAALDLQVNDNLNSCVDHILNLLLEENKSNKISDFYRNLEYVVLKASEYFIKIKNISNTKLEDVVKKFETFLLEGKEGLVGDHPKGLQKNLTINQNSVILHQRYKGVIETGTKITIHNPQSFENLISWENLKHISNIIENNPEQINELTCKFNLATIITNGTAILGFGDIGALPGLPVMEGKSLLFKLFGGTDIVPLCIQEKNPKKLIEIIKKIAPSFCAINLEDIKAPECFEIETTLSRELSYPVFHDDQHGTAIVVTAGILNSLRYTKKKIEDVEIIINGAGAAGLSVIEMLIHLGIKNVILCDQTGAIYEGRKENMNSLKEKFSKNTNKNFKKGKLVDVIKGSDIFIGVSAPKTLTQDMIKTMNHSPIIFALANPEPEIYPKEAKEAGALIIATGRSDFPNQVNNSLAFPGIFRAIIDTQAIKITMEMKVAASSAIANLISDDKLSPEFIIPDSLDTKVAVVVANSVAKVVIQSNLSRKKNFNYELVEDDMLNWILEEKLNKI